MSKKVAPKKEEAPKRDWVREIRDQHLRKSPFLGTPAAPSPPKQEKQKK